MRLYDDSADLLSEVGCCGSNKGDLGGDATNVSVLVTLDLEALLDLFGEESTGERGTGEENTTGKETGEDGNECIGTGDEVSDTVKGEREVDGGTSTTLG